jgi:serine/threonine protein phosphatase 1
MPLRLITIGDIHGEVSLLMHLIGQLKLTHEDRLIFLGDYVDRGESSPKTVEFLRMLATQVHCIFLRGNHEDMLLDHVLNSKRYPAGVWAQNGGNTTLLQYNGNIPFEHVAFLANTLPIYNVADLVFVHAGLDPDKPMDKQDAYQMMWIREPWLSAGTVKDFTGTIFHGHSPISDAVPMVHNQRVCLDSGAFKTGILTAGIISASGTLEVVQVKKDEPALENAG